MQRLRLFGLALVAVFALGAVASATASAQVGLLVLLGEAVPVELKGESGEGVLETVGGKTVKCTKSKDTGTLTTTKTGEATIDFEGCKEGKAACSSSGDAKEVILLSKLKTRLADELTAGKELQGVVYFTLSSNLKFTCALVKVEVKGAVPCLVKPINTEITSPSQVTISCAQSGGKQSTGTCEAPSGGTEGKEEKEFCEKVAKEPLEAKIGTSFEGSGEQIESKLTPNKMVEFMA